MAQEDVLEKALEVIKRYSLCDQCLGSLFARLGKGLGNDKRGSALRRTIIMEMDKRVREGLSTEEELKEILRNLSEEETKEIAKALNIELGEIRKCYVCGNQWKRLIEEWSERLVRSLGEIEFRTFIVGCTNCGAMDERQKAIIADFRLSYAESIKNAFKRELGKVLKDKLGKEPDFVDPEVVVIIDLEKNQFKLQIKPLYIYGFYKKLTRRCSQSVWKYECSVEGYLKEALKEFDAEEVTLHASGREDVDVRTLGSGRPFIAKISKPKKRYIPINGKTYSNEDVKITFLRYSSKDEVPKLKGEESLKEKIYFAIVTCDQAIDEKELEALEQFFVNLTVAQRTPKRVLHRRKDLIRSKMVYWVKTRKLDKYTFIALIKGEGGLYIKELISGDNRRTEPSFSSFLSKDCKCKSLDVVWINVGKD